MESFVAKRRFSQEQQVGQPHTWCNGAVHSRGSHIQEDQYQRRDSWRWTGWDGTYTSSITFQPVTVYGRTKYDMDIQHHQGGRTTPTNLYFDRGILSRDNNYRGVRSCHPVHAGSAPFNHVGVNAHRKEWSRKEQFVRDMDVALRSRSSERKRSKTKRSSRGDQLKPKGHHNITEVKEKHEETQRIEKTYPKRKRIKRRSSSCKRGVVSMTEQMTDASPQELPISSMVEASLDHENLVSVSGTPDVVSTKADLSNEVNEKSEGANQLLNTTVVVLEKDELAGVTIDLNHAVGKAHEETKYTVITNPRKRSRKQRSKPSKCVVVSIPKEMINVSMPEEMADSSSRGLRISSTAGNCVDHESVVSEKDEMPGVNIDMNYDVNDKPKEGKLIAKTRSKKRKRKQSFEEHGNKVLTMKVQKTVELLPSVPLDGLLLANVDNSSLQALQFSDTAILKSRRKLLVLDVNGLLVDIVADFRNKLKPDFILSGKGVFKRPFCDDFLKFCFERFDVGVWSSRTKKNLTRVVDLLWKTTKEKLLFCWDNSHCTETGYRTVENNNKPLVLKELKKLWEKKWRTGFYNESNTILLDDSPYKALRNPPYTAVFPFPYSFKNVEDRSLGPDGDLRLYLERLANAENVQNFIQANHFGQRSITTDHPSWTFYSKISGSQRQKVGVGTRNSHQYL